MGRMRIICDNLQAYVQNNIQNTKQYTLINRTGTCNYSKLRSTQIVHAHVIKYMYNNLTTKYLYLGEKLLVLLEYPHRALWSLCS